MANSFEFTLNVGQTLVLFKDRVQEKSMCNESTRETDQIQLVGVIDGDVHADLKSPRTDDFDWRRIYITIDHSFLVAGWLITLLDTYNGKVRLTAEKYA